MGNKFIDIQTNNYIYHEQFTPFIFFPKISEEISEEDENHQKYLKLTEIKMMKKILYKKKL